MFFAVGTLKLGMTVPLWRTSEGSAVAMRGLSKEGRLRDAIFHCGLDRDSFELIRVAMSKRNLRVLSYTATLLSSFGLLFFAMSLVAPIGHSLLYLFQLVSGIALLLVKRLVKPKDTCWSMALCYLLILIVLAYATALSFLPGNVGNPSVSFVVFLVLMPLTVLDVAWHMYAVCGLFAAVFLGLSFFLKPTTAAITDTIDVGSFFVLGMLLYTIVSNECVRELNDRRRLLTVQQHLIVSMATEIEARDENTGGHIKRIGDYVAGMVSKLRKQPSFAAMSDAYWENVIDAAPLHDIGKVRVPDTILNKPAKLTDEEFETIKMHPIWGTEIVEKTFGGVGEEEFLRTAQNIVLYHHERWDGSGYPTGASGTDIPLEARIMAIADVYDAIVSKRAYKPPFSPEEAKRVLQNDAGVLFDPMLVEVFLDYLKSEEANVAAKNEAAQTSSFRRIRKKEVVGGAPVSKIAKRISPRVQIVDAALAFVGMVFTIAGIVALFGLFSAREITAETRGNYEECVTAATDLLEASDFLTTQSRMFVFTGDISYMDSYLDEYLTTKRRDGAVDILKRDADGTPAERELEEALEQSNELAKRELYAMKLVADTTELEDVPTIVSTVELSSEDANLNADQKSELARQLLFSSEYEKAKREIIDGVNDCGEELANGLMEQRTLSFQKEKQLQGVLLAALVVDATLLAIAWVSNHLLIMRPMKSHEHHIKNNEPLEVYGSSEIRAVAESYNRLYNDIYRRTMLLKHQARTDALTGLLNRGSFDHLLANHGGNIALLMIDVDMFKSINDKNGHEVGDRVLQNVGNTLRSHFRTTDYVFRVGGDEFAAVLTDMTTELRSVVSNKLDTIVRDLANPTADLPAVTLSVGIAFSDTLRSGATLYHAADEALYEAKHLGRNRYVYYDDMRQGDGNERL